MKKILVTGAGGFIGSHLTEMCVEQGYEVRALVHYNSMNSWGWLDKSEILSNIEVISGDVCDYKNTLRAMTGMDSVFHLAALIGIPFSYVASGAYVQTNIIGTYNILESARELGLENIVITSTSETYGTAQHVPMDENHPLVGQSPYSASKIAADQLAISYHRSFGLPVRIARPFNAYGPRQSARAIIPTIMAQIVKNKKELKIGNTEPSRDLTFVRDTASGILAIAHSKDATGEVINIGMQEETKIGDLAHMIARIAGVEIELKIESQRVRSKESEVHRLLCDKSKINKLTDWQPEYTLERGLKETFEWIKDHIDQYKSDIYNL